MDRPPVDSIAAIGYDVDDLHNKFNQLCKDVYEAIRTRLDKGGAAPTNLYLGAYQHRVLSRSARYGAMGVTMKRDNDTVGSRFMFYDLQVFEVFAINHLAVV